jgi:hypothetical protein
MHGIAGDLTGACSLPSAYRRPKRRGGGYYADPHKKALAGAEIQFTKQVTIALAALNAVAIIFLLQINVGSIPLFPSKLSHERADKINALTSDLSQGILVSTFFYLLLVRIPERAKAMRIKALILPKILSMANDIEISLMYLINRSGQKVVDLTLLERSSFDQLTGLTGLPMNFKYEIQYPTGVWVPFGIGEHSDIEYLEWVRQRIARTTDEILSLPHVSDEDEGLVDLLPRLRDCSLHRCLNGYIQLPPDRWKVSVPEFSDYLFEYWSLYIRLRKASGSGPPVRITASTSERPC